MILPEFTRSLRFQISISLLVVVALFTGAAANTFFALRAQQNNDVILHLVSKLQLASKQLIAQGMNYKENAPRDYSTYTRDLRLYYQDLMAHVDTFDLLTKAFMHGKFDPELTGMGGELTTELGAHAQDAVNALERAWLAFRRDLFDAMGPDREMPRLEIAAKYIVANHPGLDASTNEMANKLGIWAMSEMEQINRVNQSVLIAAVVVSLGIIIGFYRKVLSPLNRAVVGFQRVAQGDFGHQVEAIGENEIALLTRSFNRLSRRVDAIFRLLDRLQQGSDLKETLAFISEEFQDFLRIDWVGAVFVTGDGSATKLEGSFLDGHPEITSRHLYRLQGTLLEKALEKREPLHVPDVQSTAKIHPEYEFLHALADKGMQDSIFLPLVEQSPVPGILVFATRQDRAYTGEHLELLTNIAHLVTHSFGRTVKLAEQTRLAAVGEFASGIAHEVRSPLATVGMALDYFQKLDLPNSASKRAELARNEIDRIARLLEDMLLYAKPIRLSLQSVSMDELVRSFLETHKELAQQRRQQFVLHSNCNGVKAIADPDRLFQIFLNLARNACEASNEGESIHWSLQDRSNEGVVDITVANPGQPIAPDIQASMMEPFFTTKSNGTGLGLAIVKRLTEAQGGELSIASDTNSTRVTLSLPCVM